MLPRLRWLQLDAENEEGNIFRLRYNLWEVMNTEEMDSLGALETGTYLALSAESETTEIRNAC